MKLVVIGGAPLDTLEDWVRHFFTRVKKVDVNPVQRIQSRIWEANKIYWLEGVQDIQKLTLSWVLPPLQGDYLKKADKYIDYLLGHEGKGSLFYLLKSRRWATSIDVGVDNEGIVRNSFAHIFVMRLVLTDSGIEKISEIIGFVYQFIKLLRENEPSHEVFRELKELTTVDFKYKEDTNQVDYAASLAEGLLLYRPEHVIYGAYAYDSWEPESIKSLLKFFKLDNMRVDIITRSLEKRDGVEVEPWFNVKYVKEDFSPSQLLLWEDPQIDDDLHFPANNEFIPSDFSIFPEEADCGLEYGPKCIVDDPFIKIWYKQDKKLKVPRASAFFKITRRGACNLAESLLGALFFRLLLDELTEMKYQAEEGHLNMKSLLHDSWLEIKVCGFNHKLLHFLEKVLAATTSFQPKRDRFKVVKEELKKTLKNQNMDPIEHSKYLLSQVLCESFWDVKHKYDFLKTLTFTDLETFMPVLLSQLYIEGLCHGNLLEEHAKHVSDIFKAFNTFKAIKPVSCRMQHKAKFMHLEPHARLIRDVKARNEKETCSMFELYFQIQPKEGVSIEKLSAVTRFVHEVVNGQFVDELRTKGQLGYVVECRQYYEYGILGLSFCIRSATYNPIQIGKKVNKFIDDRKKKLDLLTEEMFENIRRNLTAGLLEEGPSLENESDRIWNCILDKRYMFNRLEKEVAEMQGITEEDLVDWYETYFSDSSSMRRTLCIRVWGCSTKSGDADSPKSSVQHIKKEGVGKKRKQGSGVEELIKFKNAADWVDNA